MNTQIVASLSQIRSARRYKWFAMGIVWLLCISGWTLVSQLPDQFRTEARVKIDSATVVAPILAERRVEVDDATRMALVIELMLGNDSIRKMVELAGPLRPGESEFARLLNLRESVDLGGGENDIYVLSAVQTDPRASLQLLNTASSAMGETAKAMLDYNASGELREVEPRIHELEGKLNDAHALTARNAANAPGQKPASPEPQDPRIQPMKTELESLVKRRDELHVALERAAQAHPDVFRVVDQPVEPSAPFSPNRIALHALVLMSALAAALLLAVIVNLLRPSVSTAVKLREVTGLPVLGWVEVRESPAFQRTHRVSRLAFLAALTSLGVLFLAVLVLEGNGVNLHHLSA